MAVSAVSTCPDCIFILQQRIDVVSAPAASTLPSYSHLPGTTTRGRRAFYMKGFCSLPLKPSAPVLSVSVSASLEAVICPGHLGKSVLASHLSMSKSWEFKKVACNIQEEKAFVTQLTCRMLESILLPSSISAP